MSGSEAMQIANSILDIASKGIGLSVLILSQCAVEPYIIAILLGLGITCAVIRLAIEIANTDIVRNMLKKIHEWFKKLGK